MLGAKKIDTRDQRMKGVEDAFAEPEVRQMSLQGRKHSDNPAKRDTFMAQGSSPLTSPLVAELAEKQLQRRGRRCPDWAPLCHHDAVHALQARSHFAVVSQSSWTQSYCTPEELNHSAHALDAAWSHLHRPPQEWLEIHRLCRRSMLAVGGHHQLYVAAFGPEHLQNPWEREKAMCRRAHGGGHDCAGMSAAVRASVDDCVCDPVAENRSTWDSTREKASAMMPRWEVPTVGKAYGQRSLL